MFYGSNGVRQALGATGYGIARVLTALANGMAGACTSTGFLLDCASGMGCALSLCVSTLTRRAGSHGHEMGSARRVWGYGMEKSLFHCSEAMLGLCCETCHCKRAKTVFLTFSERGKGNTAFALSCTGMR